MKYPTERRENKFSAKEMKERLGAVVISWHKSEHESIVSRFLSGSDSRTVSWSYLGIPNSRTIPFPNVADECG